MPDPELFPNGLQPSGVAGEWEECGAQTVPLVSCGGSAVKGATTPEHYWRKYSGKSGFAYTWTNGVGNADEAFPSPELVFNVAGSGANVWALEFTIPYDSTQIAVLDVVAPIDITTPANDRPAVFFEDDGSGVSVRVVGLFQRITRVALVFDLKVDADPLYNPQFTRLDWTDYQTGGASAAQNITAYDEDGAPISATVSALGIL